MVNVVIDYVQHSPMTVLDPSQHWLLDGLPDDPVSICASARTLVLSPEDAVAVGVPKDRLKEQNIRPVRDLVAILARRWPERLERPRPPEARVVGASRHAATLACSLLREHGYAARVRCGFRTVTSRETPRTHWTAEWWSPYDERWMRMDPDPASTGSHPDAGEAPTDFVTAGEAWQLYRTRSPGRPDFASGADSAHVSARISAGVVRDLAALCKAEMLPTDTWGRMAMPQHAFMSAAYLHLIDVVASLCVRDEPAGLVRLFASNDLAVPPHMIESRADEGAV
ncbi:transglutaminase [Streptomyces sp. NBC_00659]|uniref:transglutaminase domain-containing protein n=1 Tax=Streptomyces sp. NBC_00659 TaxID=2903669 RepID=UPI002E343C59|nr:transglutaminase domain-containing protein [Streptomyces sp. NBC_00659]